MKIEFETQVLNVDAAEIAAKLRALGAAEQDEVFQKRWVYDIQCLNSVDPGMGEWIRLRQVGDKSTLTYKNKKGTGITDTSEIELAVEDFEKMAAIMDKLPGFTGKYYQENKRKQFLLGQTEFNLDSWPKIPPFLEIEAESEAAVHEGLKLLGLEEQEHGHFGLINIYAKHGISIHDYKELKF
jgi:adenylate cyclase class 2